MRYFLAISSTAYSKSPYDVPTLSCLGASGASLYLSVHCSQRHLWQTLVQARSEQRKCIPFPSLRALGMFGAKDIPSRSGPGTPL